MSSEPQRIETDWSADDLQNETVAFRIITEDNQAIYGKGSFDLIDRPSVDKLKRVEIVVNTFDGFKGTTTRYFIPQNAVDKIVRNPVGSDCQFSLFLW